MLVVWMDVLLAVPMVDSMVWKMAALKAALKAVLLAVSRDVKWVDPTDASRVVA